MDQQQDLFLEDPSSELYFENELFPETEAREERTERFLRHDDYSLNSPIILDGLEYSYERRSQSKLVKPGVEREFWSLYRSVENPVKPQEIHRVLFDWILRQKSNQTLHLQEQFFHVMTKFLKEILKTPNSLKSVLDAFFSSIITKETSHNVDWVRFENRIECELINQSSELVYYWSLYQIFRFIVLQMNSLNMQERHSITSMYRDLGLDVTEETVILDGIDFMRYQLPLLGDIYIGSGSLMISSINLVMDKNLTLMIQDLLSSRFCTMLFLLYPDPRYSATLPSFVARLYRLGDLMIKEHGNKAYDTIKLIEPVCNRAIKRFAEFSEVVISDTTLETYLMDEFTRVREELGFTGVEFLNHLEKLPNYYDAVLVFGLFRHWGHPFIEYFEGLKKLHANVQMEKEIDSEYVQLLASDLARKIIRYHFRRQKVWPIELEDLEPTHIFYKHVRDSTWPNRGEERKFGDKWHELPIKKVFDAPTSINLSEVLDDKSHSLGFTGLKKAIMNSSVGTSSQRKVILSTLYNPEINIPSFLDEIDKNGLPKDDLVIGLRAKEREMKRIGRFFALMTLKLRIYFVVTEFMLSNYVLPLFPSLTMTSSMNKVFKKMGECVPGHGTDFSTRVTYAEHFDYEKWNNHQRYESTAPIFQVIDKSFGFSNLITRTHEFFQKSFIYFANRPDLMVCTGEGITNRDPSRMVCWQGQLGGLEGLRQKGWSLISLLMIERESRNRNPRVRTLAQGDNQVVCITYLLPRETDPSLAKTNYIDVYRNRTYLLDCIQKGARKLGLIIKPDESWSSYNYLVYGKFSLVGGNLVCSEAKRFSRVNVVSNDLVQNLSNALSSVVTNCLTVCQQSDSIVKPIHLFAKYGVWVIKSILSYDLAAFRPILTWKEIMKLDHGLTRVLLTDSSLGGLGGSSLLRFTIRQFPDAVTESLSFWKLIHDNVEDPQLKNLAVLAGNPKIKKFELRDLLKLIDSPTSINCKTGTTPTSVLKNLVREELIKKIHLIKHNTIRECLNYTHATRDHFLTYLNSIQPKFPRFLSNFYSGSIYGFMDSIIGLIQNSRTVRLLFTPKFTKKICERISKTEYEDALSLLTIVKHPGLPMWGCSATKADQLRKVSWGNVVGETIPHPAEFIKLTDGHSCPLSHQDKKYLTCHYNIPCPLYPQLTKGPCTPYMGSETSDLTELYHAWERKTELVLLKKALSLRSVVHWFVNPDSSIHKALISNLQSLTEEDASELMAPGPTRSGSYIHRYSTPFQSAGGFSAICQNKLRYILSTTDTMSDLSDTNWDFMYQSVLLFGQTIIAAISDSEIGGGIIHGHINCPNCLRPVETSTLETPLSPPLFHSLQTSESLYVRRAQMPFVLDQIQLENLPSVDVAEFCQEISLQIGNTQGFLHTLSFCYDLQLDDLGSLFPKSVFDNLNPPDYFTGFLMGVIRGTLINSLNQQFMFNKRDRVLNLRGQLLANLFKINETRDIASLISSSRFSKYLSTVSHITGAHYPLNSDEILELLRTYLIAKVSKNLSFYIRKICNIQRVILFPETITAFTAAGLVVSIILCQGILKTDTLNRTDICRIKTVMLLTNARVNSSIDQLMKTLSQWPITLLKCMTDMKSVSKAEIFYTMPTSRATLLYREYEGASKAVFLRSNTQPVDIERHILTSKGRYNPLISGLRLIQIQTGSHYKLKCLFRYIPTSVGFAICGGDYSGGFSSVLLRKFPKIRVVFNSLLDLSKFPGGGMHPAPPSAISRLPEEQRIRCINLQSAWEEPSDLSFRESWETLLGHFPKNSVDLIVIDAEVTEPSTASRIAFWIDQFSDRYDPRVFVIFKCYYSMLKFPEYTVLTTLVSLFESVQAVTTEYTGSFSSEFYVICNKLRRSSQKRFIDASSLYELSTIIPANQTIEREFFRALYINLDNTCLGLTKDFWVKSEVILLGLLNGLSIAPVIGGKIECCFKESRCFSEFFGSILFALSYLIKELNVKVQNGLGTCDGIPIPSADWSEGFGCMILGTLFYISYLLKSVPLYSSLTDMELLILFYHVTPNGIFKWSFSEQSSTSIRCRLSRKRHLMATWIRVFECWRYEKKFAVEDINFPVMETFFAHAVKAVEYRWFNLKSLERNTGFKDLLDLFLPRDLPLLTRHKCAKCPTRGKSSEDETAFYSEITHEF
ncbi:TPA_asm: L protein [Sphaeridiorhabdovirus 2]|nr:TPA_asm: L protein [Sphaeridiorhabdovirus 2]